MQGLQAVRAKQTTNLFLEKMLSLYSASSCIYSPKITQFFQFRSNYPKTSTRIRTLIIAASNTNTSKDQRANFAGVKLEETVETKNSNKLRLDSWISSRITGISRARVQSSIKSGLVSVNDRVVNKVSYGLRDGDVVKCTIAELEPLRAQPENIPLDIVYEDEDVLVVNKPPHMVVHPAPGNANGTLVNGILHHCSLPMVTYTDQNSLSDAEDFPEFTTSSLPEDFGRGSSSSSYAASIRPGIVHRLDKGTSGLLVVAKNEHAHAHLAEQFKSHSIQRVYISLTSGVPSPIAGRVDIPIGRDVNNRVRMTAAAGSNTASCIRHAASTKSWKSLPGVARQW